NSGSCFAYFSAIGRSNARVLVTWGVMSGSNTSVITSTSSPPRIGAGHENTGFNTQSEFEPGAWVVLDPSKPQMGSSAPSFKIFVFERSRAVGSVPSIQMYSALIITSPCAGALGPSRAGSLSGWQFPGGCPSVNALLLPPTAVQNPRRPAVPWVNGAPVRVRVADGRGAGGPLRSPLVHRRS